MGEGNKKEGGYERDRDRGRETEQDRHMGREMKLPGRQKPEEKRKCFQSGEAKFCQMKKRGNVEITTSSMSSHKSSTKKKINK